MLNSCPFRCDAECDVVDICVDDNRWPHSEVTRRSHVKVGGMLYSNHNEIKLVNYAIYLCRCAKSKASTVISNADERHAQIVFAELIKSARKTVQIYCSEMDLERFNQTGSELRKVFHAFLRRLGDIQVQVLLDGSSETTLALLTKLPIPDQIQIKVISPEGRRQIKSEIGSNGDFHLLIVDKKAYRYEYDTLRHAAIGSFNDRSQSEYLMSGFNRAFKASQHIKNVGRLH